MNKTMPEISVQICDLYKADAPLLEIAGRFGVHLDTVTNIRKRYGLPDRKSPGNYIGKRYGKILVIGAIGERNSHGKDLYECLCDCGKTEIRPAYRLSQSVNGGLIPKCKDCRDTIWGNRWRLAPGESSFNAVTRQYKRDHPEMKNITDGEFRELFTANCEYCGEPPSNIKRSECDTGDFIYSGIDAVQPKLGHVRDNLVSCCVECNRRKWGNTPQEWFAHMTKVQQYQSKKGLGR